MYPQLNLSTQLGLPQSPAEKQPAITCKKVSQMSNLDTYELEVLSAFEGGQLKSIATKSEIDALRAAARATSTKDKRVNIRLSSFDLKDIQVKAMEEGVPYQTLIAGVLHKYVNGHLSERVRSEER